MSQITAIVISITLEGPNYPEWAFCVETTLRGHGLLFHLTDNAPKLKEDGSNATAVKDWGINDGKVMAAMVNSTKQSLIMSLGHLCGSRLSSMINKGCLGHASIESSFHCKGCKLGKQIQLPYSSGVSHSARPFDLIHLDVWGVLHLLLQRVATNIMSFLLLIILAIHGFIS